LVAGMQPGAKLFACGTIKALDDQTLQLRIEEVTDKKDDLPDYEKDEDGEEDAEGGAAEYDNEEEEDGNGSSKDETVKAIGLASPGGMDEA